MRYRGRDDVIDATLSASNRPVLIHSNIFPRPIRWLLASSDGLLGQSSLAGQPGSKQRPLGSAHVRLSTRYVSTKRLFCCSARVMCCLAISFAVYLVKIVSRSLAVKAGRPRDERNRTSDWSTTVRRSKFSNESQFIRLSTENV